MGHCNNNMDFLDQVEVSRSGPSPASIENQLCNLMSDTKVYIRTEFYFLRQKAGDVKRRFSSILD